LEKSWAELGTITDRDHVQIAGRSDRCFCRSNGSCRLDAYCFPTCCVYHIAMSAHGATYPLYRGESNGCTFFLWGQLRASEEARYLWIASYNAARSSQSPGTDK
jgi:hypothetical protein